MKRRINRNVEGNGAGGPVSFDQLDDKKLEEAVQGALAPEKKDGEEEKKEEKKENADKEEEEVKDDEGAEGSESEEENEEESEEESEEEEGEETEEESPEEKEKREKAEKEEKEKGSKDDKSKLGEKKDKGKKDEVVLKLKSIAKDGTEEEKEMSWQDVAKETGIPFKVEKGMKNDYEAFIKGIKENETKNFQRGLEEGKSFSIESLPPNAQVIVKALASDPKLQIHELLNPLKDFDEVLALNNKDLLLDKMINADGITKEEAQEEVERIESDGRMDIEAKKIRNIVQGQRNNQANKILSDRVQAYEKIKQTIQEREQKEEEALFKALDDTDEFIGGKISKDDKKIIKERFKDGYYKKLFASDAKAAVLSIFQHEYGDQVKERLLGKGKSQGVKEVAEKLLNKSKGHGGAKTKAAVVETKTGGDEFDAWDTIGKTTGVTVQRGD